MSLHVTQTNAVRNIYFRLDCVDTYQQEGYPGTVVTEMATDLFSSKHSQYQLSEAESENSFNVDITNCIKKITNYMI